MARSGVSEETSPEAALIERLKENPRSARQVRTLVEARLTEFSQRMQAASADNFIDAPSVD